MGGGEGQETQRCWSEGPDLQLQGEGVLGSKAWPGLQLTVLGAPGSPVVRTGRFPSCGTGSISGQGTKILQAVWPGKEERKQHCIVCLRFAKCSQHTQRCHVG